HRVATRSLHTVDVWEASADGSALTPVSRFNIGTGLPLLALHPSGQVVAVGDGNVVRVVDLHGASHAELELGDARPVSVAWYPDGRTLAIGTSVGSIRLLPFGDVAVY
ncbi:MAG: hypothetical protein SFX74_00295, partial [Fimbriimonadaceae bacterium]|nr:hypothetical protein [Fimbriimonadaceae bacterium]